MINWFNMPAEGMSNGGLFEVKELNVTENGTYEQSGEMYNKVTVNVEGGGTSYTTLFEGNVTTAQAPMGALTTIEGLEPLTADTIKVTFNGTEYTCDSTEDGYGDRTFANYPFCVFNNPNETVSIITQTAGTYTLKIEAPQSGGESDFSTAEVSVVGNDIEISMPVCSYDPDSPVGYYLEAPTSRDPVKTSGTYTTVLYKGYQVCYCGNALIGGSITLSGNCEWVNEEDGMLLITGDCTITIS